ncbi:hypothetical protein ACSSS7_008424 [Eimeria intestinalis]
MPFEQHSSELEWMESLSLRAAAEQRRRDRLTSGTPATSAGVADRLRDELSREDPVSAERVADLFRLWFWAHGPSLATAIVPPAPTAVAPASESEAATQPLERTDTVDQQAAELVAAAPGDLREGDSPPPWTLPRPYLSPPYALGLDGLANGSASLTGDLGGERGGDSSSVGVLGTALPVT